MKVPCYFDFYNTENKNIRKFNGIPLEKTNDVYQDHETALSFLPFNCDTTLTNNEFLFPVTENFNEKFYYPIYMTYTIFPQNKIQKKLKNFEIPKFILDSIKNKKCKILMTNIFEGWDLREMDKLVLIHFVKKYKISPTDVAYLLGNLQNYSPVGIKNIYYNFWESIFEHHVYNESNSFESPIDLLKINSQNIFNDLHRKHKFICLQRRPTAQRIALFTELYDRKNEGILTLGSETKSYPMSKMKDNIEEVKIHFGKSYKKFQEQNLENKIPYQFDIDAYNENPTHDKNYQKFLDSYLHIVSETYFHDSKCRIFFSEKIFKPVVFLQPFVLFSAPHSLKHFRSLGFKTFSPIIDESYDDETNDATRFYKALQSVKNFINCNYSEIHEYTRTMYPILEHNYFTLKDRRNNFRETLVVKLLEELENND